jgi:hypothetical protein
MRALGPATLASPCASAERIGFSVMPVVRGVCVDAWRGSRTCGPPDFAPAISRRPEGDVVLETRRDRCQPCWSSAPTRSSAGSARTRSSPPAPTTPTLAAVELADLESSRSSRRTRSGVLPRSIHGDQGLPRLGVERLGVGAGG